MTRNEMLEHMSKAFYEYISDYGLEYTLERVLTRMESKGMLPPFYRGDLSSYDIAMGSNCNRWEPESEE